MASNSDEVRAAEALNSAWDRRVLGPPAEEPALDTPELKQLAQLLACDDAPDPEPTFVAQLRDNLLSEAVSRRLSSRSSSASLGITKTSPTLWTQLSWRRVALAAVIAACFTLAISAGSSFLRDEANAPTVASVLASPAGTPTAGPTTTAWVISTTAISVGHEVTLLPHIEATATNDPPNLVVPTTGLTVLDSATDGTGQRWLRVQTNDGRAGWLPQSDTQSPQQ